MSDQTLWGLLLVLYVLPAGVFMVWRQSEDSVSDIRKELYPGRTEILDDESKRESQFTKFTTVWCIGLVLLLAAYSAQWNPVGTGVLVIGLSASLLALYFGYRRFKLQSNRLFRFWLAGLVVWSLTVLSWYLVFGSHSELSNGEFLLLALLPAVVAAVGIVVWQWANRS